MLLVKTYIRNSTIEGAGIGCFAAEFIPKGTKIWEMNPLLDRLITQEEFEGFSELEKVFIDVYGYKHNGVYYLCIDNARFFNHSSSDCNTLDPEDNMTYAKVDIHPDDEILSDYTNFGVTEEDKIWINADINNFNKSLS